jgi:ATP-dependent DNA helicase PIF1
MIDKTPLQLNDDFKFALDTLEKSQRSLFITGRAGTGKSTLLNLFKMTTKKKIVVLAHDSFIFWLSAAHCNRTRSE